MELLSTNTIASVPIRYWIPEKLHHSNIVQYFALNYLDDSNRIQIIMEYMPGGTLKEFIITTYEDSVQKNKNYHGLEPFTVRKFLEQVFACRSESSRSSNSDPLSSRLSALKHDLSPHSLSWRHQINECVNVRNFINFPSQIEPLLGMAVEMSSCRISARPA